MSAADIQLQRVDTLRKLGADQFDVLVIGGGATGLGTAVDAANRGYKTALVEAHDWAKGTSSRSTKLVHGGVRYLEQLDLALVMEALRERGLLHQNASHFPGAVRDPAPVATLAAPRRRAAAPRRKRRTTRK